MNGRIWVLGAILFAGFVLSSGAQVEIHDDAGTRAAAFLKMESGGRAAAMSGAFTGLADDVDGLFWNPAGLTALENRQLTGTQNFSFGGVNHETIAYGQRLTETSVLAASFQGAFATIERRAGDTLEADSEFTASTFGIGLSYAQAFGPISLGGTVKALQERFDVVDNTGVAFDLGALFEAGPLRLGASVLNLGPNLADFALPMTIRVGGSALLAKTGPRVAVDLVVPSDDFVSVRFGAEQWFFDQVAVRGGYFWTEAENPAKGFSVGMGFKSQGTKSLEAVDFQIDYAFVPENGVGDAHRVSFLTRF